VTVSSIRRTALASVAAVAIAAVVATGCSPTREAKKAPSDAAVKRRVVSVKVENSPQARPQTGLNSADVVYESVTEGGITRFNALFHSTDPKTVGPVRSARLSDLWIVPQYGALFFYSGASSTINGRVNGMGLENLSQDNGVFAPYFRSSERSAPHNLYLRMKAARAEGKKRGYPASAQAKPLRFSGSVQGSDTVTEIRVPLSDVQTTTWVYRKGSGDYVRSDNGNKSTDAATGKRVTADNVVVLWARYKPFSRDKAGSTTYDINLGGDGRASVFRDGVKIDGTWEATREAPPVLKTEDGAIIKLAPGRTWFEVVDKQVDIKLK